MQIIEWLKRKAEKRYNKLYGFYKNFEVEIPSLEYKLMTKFPKNRWLTLLVMQSINIGFFIFWLISLYYVSSVLNQCETQMTLFKLQINGNCTDYTCTNFKNIWIDNANITLRNLTDIVKSPRID